LEKPFEDVKKKEKTASCSELKGVLEKVRMLRDNKEWEDEPEWMAINHLSVHLLDLFKKSCKEMWIRYTNALAPRYKREMEEAWYMRQVKPLKERSKSEEGRDYEKERD